MTTIETDVLVVGGGLAALRAAYDALGAGSKVTLAVKGKSGRSGSSAMTSAGYSSAVVPEDSPELHLADTLQGGRGLNDPNLVRIMAAEAPLRLRELVELGGVLAQDGDRPVVHPSGDHSVPRTVVAAHHTGRDFTEPLARAVADRGCQVLEMTAVLDLLVHDGQIAGAIAVSYGQPDELILIRARTVVVGTGGAGRLFAVTSNPNDVTGDGYALALRAGAALRDMEFIQFYPWRCIVPFDRSRMPIQPSTFVLGARLYNAAGERFMTDYDPVRHEAAGRDVAARGIYDQIRFGKAVQGGVRLDVSDLTTEEWARSNPKPYRYFADRDIDFRQVEMILSPEGHFFMGGVVVDEHGESAVSGLFVVGETAGGVHGANRLDSNALPETQVFGARAGRAAAARAGRTLPDPDPATIARWERWWQQARNGSGADRPLYAELRSQLQSTMWHKLGIVRDAQRLQEGLAEISSLHGELDRRQPAGARELLQHRELENSLLVAESCFTAALLRDESRGAHFRLDCPDRDDNRWLQVIAVLLGPAGRPELQIRPV